VIFFIF